MQNLNSLLQDNLMSRLRESFSDIYANLFRQSWENSPLGWIITDAQGYILEANRKAEWLAGDPHLISKCIDEALQAQDNSLYLSSYYANLYHSQRGATLETQIFNKEGASISVDIVINKHDLQEQPLFCFLLIDVSARVAAEKSREEKVREVHELKTKLDKIEKSLADWRPTPSFLDSLGDVKKLSQSLLEDNNKLSVKETAKLILDKLEVLEHLVLPEN